jgi:poly-beta-1,6-N-acetyl-D-glucosamine synthase
LRKRQLALVIPAHNEEVVIANTIRSALRAGQKRRDIYVASNTSTDQTAVIAANLLGEGHVIEIGRQGKALAVKTAVDYFKLTERYDWIHIADADGVFAADYFKIFKNRLDTKKYAAATGYVQSLPGDYVSKYRVYEYTWGLQVVRRFQALFGVITVIPGPTSCFRSDVFEKLDFDGGTLTEDFDVTLQIHRLGLGKIGYFPDAKTETQDPKDLGDYITQVSRWDRGLFQNMRKHHIGLRPQKIDAYLSYQILEVFLYGYIQLIFWPTVAIATHSPAVLAIGFLNDLAVFLTVSIITAAVSKRWDMLTAFPMFYVLRWINLLVFYRSFFEIMILNKFRNPQDGWDTGGKRRYAITSGSVN